MTANHHGKTTEILPGAMPYCEGYNAGYLGRAYLNPYGPNGQDEERPEYRKFYRGYNDGHQDQMLDNGAPTTLPRDGDRCPVCTHRYKEVEFKVIDHMPTAYGWCPLCNIVFVWLDEVAAWVEAVVPTTGSIVASDGYRAGAMGAPRTYPCVTWSGLVRRNWQYWYDVAVEEAKAKNHFEQGA